MSVIHTTWLARTVRSEFNDGEFDLNEPGLLSLWNGSDDIVDIVAILANVSGSIGGQSAPSASLSVPGTYQLVRINSITGGTSLNLIQHDTTTNAPANIDIRQHPDNVVATAVLRQLVDTPGISTTSSMRERRNRFANILSTHVAPVVLQQGEGVALVDSSIGQSYPHDSSVDITLRIANATHHLTMPAASTPIAGQKAHWAILNNATEPIEVLDVVLTYKGNLRATANTLPLLRLVATHAPVTTGEPISAVATDTQSSTLSPLIEIRKNFDAKTLDGVWPRTSLYDRYGPQGFPQYADFARMAQQLIGTTRRPYGHASLFMGGTFTLSPTLTLERHLSTRAMRRLRPNEGLLIAMAPNMDFIGVASYAETGNWPADMQIDLTIEFIVQHVADDSRIIAATIHTTIWTASRRTTVWSAPSRSRLWQAA